MRFAAEQFFNAFCDFREVHRRAVALEREVCESSRILDTDMGRILSSPLAERIAADALRDEEPSRKRLGGATFYTLLLQIFCEEFQKLLFRHQFIWLDGRLEIGKCSLHLLGKLLIDVPARPEIIVFAAVVEMMSDC